MAQPVLVRQRLVIDRQVALRDGVGHAGGLTQIADHVVQGVGQQSDFVVRLDGGGLGHIALCDRVGQIGGLAQVAADGLGDHQCHRRCDAQDDERHDQHQPVEGARQRSPVGPCGFGGFQLIIGQPADLRRGRINSGIHLAVRKAGQRGAVARQDNGIQPRHRLIRLVHILADLCDDRPFLVGQAGLHIGRPVPVDDPLGIGDGGAGLCPVELAGTQLVRGIDDVDGIGVRYRLELTDWDEAIVIDGGHGLGQRIHAVKASAADDCRDGNSRCQLDR
nr:hypothetical protein [uncultured Sphingomonas sp.]